MIVEGLYILLDQKPWSHLTEKGIFEKTYFIDTPENKTVMRLKNRMVNEMKLEEDVAQSRIDGNDLVNARFIKENTDLDKHEVVTIQTQEERERLASDLM